MTPSALRQRLGRFPSLPIVRAPSPLAPLANQEKILGTAAPLVWVKRDDELGPGIGGNKGRKLAYLLAEPGLCSRVVTFGGLQSNHARMTAAACAALGLEAHLFFFERRPARLTGNLLLNHLLGARMHFVPLGGSGSGRTLEATNRLVRLLSALWLGPGTSFIPVGGHSPLGCLGYVEAACELHGQALDLGLPLERTTVITAAGTGGTLAGLLAGFKLLGSPLRGLGIDVGKLWRHFPRSVARLCEAICALLGEPHAFESPTLPLLEEVYVGEAYGRPSVAGMEAIRRTASGAGLLLDPIYSGKAFAGLADLVRGGRFARDETLIFVHTGGLPGLWAHEALLAL